MDKSGSCAVFALLVEDTLYVGNVGDSRAILSCEGGKRVVCLTEDHKPNQEGEKKRIIEKGGKVYQYIALMKDTDTCQKSEYSIP